MELNKCSLFTFEEITDAYNQTRVDYLVPMPMNVARLREYARIYDVDLEQSFIAVKDNILMGLTMLGVREHRSWITRLGVLPSGRRQGTATALMEGAIQAGRQLKHKHMWLEVIKGNAPAHRLFSKYGFEETRELIVARRAPNPELAPVAAIRQVTSLPPKDTLILLTRRREQLNWLNQTESFHNVHNLHGLMVELTDGGKGFVAYQASMLQLTHIYVTVIDGDPVEVTKAVLHALHERYPRQDAIAENLTRGPIWDGYKQAGYFDSFRRIEMIKTL